MLRKSFFLLCCLGASASFAQVIAIDNDSFEAQSLGPGSFFYSPTQITGWSTTATGGADRGVWNTTAAGKDGDNIAFAYRNNAIAQQTSAVLVAGQTINLSVLMGRTGGSTRGSLELWAGGSLVNGVVSGGTLLGSVTSPMNQSNMTPVSLSYTALAGNANLGQLLSVRLAGTTVSGESYVSFDKVQMEAVPEPATMSVLGLGLLAMLKKRKKS